MRRIIPLVLGLAACGIPSPVAGPGTTTPPPSTELRVIVPPGPDGLLPDDVIVGCPSGPDFAFGALERIGPPDPDMEEAMRPFLENEEGVNWPQEGWLLLEERENDAVLVNGGNEAFSFMYLTREGGSWSWSGASAGGPCPLQYAVPEGLNTVEWRLDPAAGSTAPESTTVAVLLTERECVGGQEIGDRLIGPQVVLTATELRIAFAAQPPPGDAFDCQGNPETPYTVTLPEPLGERQIFEGLATGLSLNEFLP